MSSFIDNTMRTSALWEFSSIRRSFTIQSCF